MKKSKILGAIITGMLAVATLGMGVVMKPASAASVTCWDGSSASSEDKCPTKVTIYCPNGTAAPDNNYAKCSWTDNRGQEISGKDSDALETVNTIVNVVTGLIGLVAVVVIIIGGFYYVTSQGDPGKAKKAKDTIMYGVIGLIVTLLAFAIVNFVLMNVFRAE